MTTPSRTVGPTPPRPAVISVPEPEPPFTVEEIDALAGDLRPGEIGWVKLDEDGTPTGTAVRERPTDKDGSFARVVGGPPPKEADLLTPSGAPITKHMNPDPQVWDEGMLARNPPPEDSPEEKKRKEAGQANPLVTGGNPPADTARPTTSSSPSPRK